MGDTQSTLTSVSIDRIHTSCSCTDTYYTYVICDLGISLYWFSYSCSYNLEAVVAGAQ